MSYQYQQRVDTKLKVVQISQENYPKIPKFQNLLKILQNNYEITTAPWDRTRISTLYSVVYTIPPIGPPAFRNCKDNEYAPSAVTWSRKTRGHEYIFQDRDVYLRSLMNALVIVDPLMKRPNKETRRDQTNTCANNHARRSLNLGADKQPRV